MYAFSDTAGLAVALGLAAALAAPASAHTLPDDTTLFVSDDGDSLGALLVVRLGANSPASQAASALDADNNGRVAGAELLLASAVLTQQLPALPHLVGPEGSWRLDTMQLARAEDNDRSWLLTIVYRAWLLHGDGPNNCVEFGVDGGDGVAAEVQWQLSRQALGHDSEGDERGHAHANELPIRWCLRGSASDERAIGDSE